MKFFRASRLILISLALGCSTINKNHVFKKQDGHLHRHLASMNEIVNDQEKLKIRVNNLMDGIFFSYLLGQIYLYDFDTALDNNTKDILKTDSYANLLAVKNYVDGFEHDINDLYLNLVIVTALPEYSAAQKQNAQIALDSIGEFLDGVKSDSSKLTETLKPLVLSNLLEKQTYLFDELKKLQEDESFTQNNEEVRKVLRKNMVLLRATRMSYYEDMKDYVVNPDEVRAQIREEKKKTSFKKFEKDVKELSKEMKTFMKEIGRGTSSEVIFPSSSVNGNISGRSFPAGTWSLTYDDGPGKTTQQVLDNLIERKIPATFFVLAKQVIDYPQTAMNLKQAGMDIASHSYTHAQLTKVGPVQLEREIGESKKVIEEKLGSEIKLFRLPYGAGTSVGNVRAKIAEHNMIHVFWTVDTLDWQDKNPQSILNRTLKQIGTQESGVVLFHDIHSQSVTASTMLMDWFNQNKTKVCTVQGVVDQMNSKTKDCR